jgi:hypothetical protein
MFRVEDYVARIEESCGGEKSFIVTFKFERKTEAVSRILKKASLQRSISNVIYELSFHGVSFRLYATGKAIFRGLKEESQVRTLLMGLLS